MNLTQHFSLEELTISETAERAGIDNEPQSDVISQLRILCDGLERIRSVLGYPIHINSGYRCPELNKAIGGAANSQHVTGNAADLICPAFGSPVAICRVIINSDIPFDQIIKEFSWVHVSFVEHQPRGSILTFNGKQYVEGIA